ncbi:MAG: hypothetical protein AAB337_03350 [Patescibacteria group bacterium]
MFWILFAGILLTVLPILGFVICGTIMMFGTIADDDGGKFILGVVASISIGLVLIITSLAARFLPQL